MTGRRIMTADEIRRATIRLSHEIVEKQAGTDGLLLIGIQRRGVPLARRIAPAGLVDIGPAQKLPRLASSKVMLHSKVSDPAKLAALRTLAATFRSVAAAR